jgi:hypothetical protein
MKGLSDVLRRLSELCSIIAKRPRPYIAKIILAAERIAATAPINVRLLRDGGFVHARCPANLARDPGICLNFRSRRLRHLHPCVAGVATEDAGCRCERHPDGSVRPLAALLARRKSSVRRRTRRPPSCSWPASPTRLIRKVSAIKARMIGWSISRRGIAIVRPRPCSGPMTVMANPGLCWG